MNKIINPEFRHEIGAYKIYHLEVPDEIYIGGTRIRGRKGRCGFYKRFCGHIKCLRGKKHHSARLQDIVNDRGIDGVVMEIIEVVNSESEVIPREQYYMDLCAPALNIIKTAGSSLGYRHTPEMIKYLSKIRIGKKLPPKSDKEKKRLSDFGKSRDLSYLRTEAVLSKKSKAMKGRKIHETVYQSIIKTIHQYSKSGEYIESFSSIKSAASSVNIHPSMISKTATGIKKSAGGYVWRYEMNM